MGAWYAAEDNPGIYVSVIQPDALAPEILRSYTHIVKSLDSVESTALVYLVAFDLDRFDLGFAIGTEHPRVDWSEPYPGANEGSQPPGAGRDRWYRPPGCNGSALTPWKPPARWPLSRAGSSESMAPSNTANSRLKTTAAIMASSQDGVVFSKLQPGLATVFVRDDGRVELKTWTKSDNEQLQRIKCARQNGVPIIEYDPITQVPAPGPLVGQWLPGNWAGSEGSQTAHAAGRVGSAGKRRASGS